MAKYILADTLSYEEAYDDIQIGEIDAKMGDVVASGDGEHLMLNGYHLEEFIPEGPLFKIVIIKHNHSTNHTFTETYIGNDSIDGRNLAHIETMSVKKTPFTLPL